MRSRLYRLRILKVPSRSRDGSANQETQEHPLCFSVAKTTGFYQPKVEENYYAAGAEEKHPVQHGESKDSTACTPINGNPVLFSFFYRTRVSRETGEEIVLAAKMAYIIEFVYFSY